MKDARRGEPVIDQFLHALPCEPVFLTSSPERASPVIGHTMPERRKRSAVCRDRIVVEVACHHLPQPLPLFGDRVVHAAPQLLLDVLQLRSHTVAAGLPLELEFSVARKSADKGEA